MEKGEEKEEFGGGKGLTLVCWRPAGLCFHRAVSPGELPDVVFLGVIWDRPGQLWVQSSEKKLRW